MDQTAHFAPYPELRELLKRQRDSFESVPYPTAEARALKLTKLELLLKANNAAFADAIAADFGNRSRVESAMSEILPLLGAITHAKRHLAKWMQPRRRAVSLNFKPGQNRVEYSPVGVVGVVAPWNYPIFLTLGPLIDILAAGNRAMIKPSELTPITSELLKSLLAQTYATEDVAVVLGDAGVAQAFCALPFDHLLFTGSTHIGRQVMQAAAANLVPVTLELGGKSPVILAPDYSVPAAAKSIAVGKFFNAGQTCTAPDYVLAPQESAQSFAEAVLAAAETMFPTIAGNPDYTAIISDRHHQRLTELVAEAQAGGAKILRHRDTTPDNVRHFAPTVVLDPPLNGRLMREEIFGPVLPVVRSASLEASLKFVNARPRPLALYVYTHDAKAERQVLDGTISGGVTVNGTLVHTGQEDLPFGGIGPSGMGAYHAAEGFYRFSHARAVHRQGFFSGFEFLKPPHGRKTRLMLRAMGITLPG